MTKNDRTKNADQRKLQLTGGSTFIVSIPKQWINRNQLKKGSAILLIEGEDGTLSIVPPKLSKQEKIEDALIRVASSENPEAVIRKIVSAYLVGYNILHVKAQGQQQLSSNLRNNLKTFARQLLVGTEIVMDSPKDLILQVILNYSELSVQSAIRRMAIITASMHKEAIAAFKNLDCIAARAVIETDNEVDRFNLYTVRLLKLAVSNPRILKEIGVDSAKTALGYRLITKSVERTADHATKIADNVLLLREKANSEVIEKIESMSELAITMFEDAMEALFKNNFNQAETVVEKLEQIMKLEKEAVLSSQGVMIRETANLRLLIESVRRTAQLASDIAEIVLNLNVESVLG